MSEINFGDYAMVINNIYDLNIKNITLFTYNKGFSDLINKEYCNSFDINTIEVKLSPSTLVKLENNSDQSEKQRVGFLPFNFPTETPIDLLYRVENIDE